MAVSTNRREDYKTHLSNIQNLKHKINIDLVQEILVDKGNVNCLIQEGFTPLYLASLEGDSRLVKALLDRGAEVNQPSKDGKTPLYIASKNGHADIVEMLLDSGAEVNLISLPTEGKETCLNIAWRLGHLEVVKVLLKKGAKPNRILETDENYESLDKAVRDGHSELVTLLLENGLRVNWVNKEGETLLYTACSMGHLNIVNILLDHGIHVNCSSSFGGTSLYIACVNNHFAIAKLLLERGADTSNKGTGCRQPSVTPLYVVAKEGQTELVRLMLDKGAEVDRTVRSNNGETPLHIACLKGHLDVVQLLLDRGADTSLSTDHHIDVTSLYYYKQTLFTPLMLALLKGHSHIVRLLLNRGTPVNQAVHQSDTSPLWLCCKEGNYDMVKMLLEYGADPNRGKRVIGSVAGFLQWTPLYIATCQGYRNIVRLLLQVGANIKNKFIKEPNLLLAAYMDGHYDIFVDLMKQMTKFDYAICDIQDIFRSSQSDVVDACIEKGITVICFNNDMHLKLVDHHLKKLKVVGLFSGVSPADGDTLNIYNSEIQNIKAFKVYNNVSLYVVFEKFKHPVYLRNLDLLRELEKSLNSPSTMKMFPIYGQILKNRLLSSKYRLSLFTKVSEALEEQEWWGNLPLPVQENILKYLKNSDLETMFCC